ncbi:AraC family transcriptional regulator [Puteibacter caeruleilacunae]|nr:AraC family transcriptional regulator [Puteibacter caeruleilacunae]
MNGEFCGLHVLYLDMDNFLRKLDIEIFDGRPSKLSKEWQMENDNTPYARLYYIKKGTGTMTTHGEHFTFKPNHLYLVPPRGNLAYNYIADLEIWWVHFTIKIFDSIDLFDYLSYDIEHVPINIAYTEEEMKQLVMTVKSNDVQSHLIGNGLLLKLIGPYFSDQHNNPCDIKMEKIKRLAPAISYIDNHLAEKITLEQLASEVRYERTYFSTIFKETFNISPSHFIMRKRIERAMFMLETTNYILEEIAERLGFSDAYHLSKTFKQFTGYAPTVYRKRRMELEEFI